MKKRFVLISLLLLGVSGFADVATSPWPKVIRDFPLKSDTLVIKDFRITAKEAADQSAGGSGGAVYDITVLNTRTGGKRILNEQCVGIRVLEFFHGWPQREIWGRAGGGSWSRSLYRVTAREYEYVRTDEFTSFEAEAKDRSVTATMPRDDEVLYYVETRIPKKP